MKMNGMNIKAKIALTIGVLVSMIVLLVALSVANLQILTATEPDSPAAGPGLNRALIWITVIGGICILIGIGMLIKLPASINSPIKQLADGILEDAVFALVDLRNRIHDDKKREQQGDEIGVRNHPPLVVLVLFFLLSASCHRPTPRSP